MRHVIARLGAEESVESQNPGKTVRRCSSVVLPVISRSLGVWLCDTKSHEYEWTDRMERRLMMRP